MLAKRLTRHGLAVSGGMLAGVLSRETAACVPPSVVSSTIKVASLFAAGQTAAISVKVAVLTEGVLKAMLLTKLKSAMASVLLIAALIGGTGLVYATQGGEGSNRQNKAKTSPTETMLTSDGVEGEKPKTDMQLLQGTWKLVETHKHGKKVDPKDIPTKPHALVIDGSKVALHYGPKDQPTKGKLELNTAATPKEMNLTWAIPSWQAIYRLEKDRLTICFNPDNGITPDEFRTTADSGRVLYVYQRAKEKPDQQPASSPTDKGEAKIGAKWDYKKLSHDEVKALEFKMRGTDTPDGGLKLLGEEGWELVAIEPPERGPASPFGDRPALYVFKRQRK
jgi:uncharacterized protein (TIGR03067 family)